MSEDDGEISKLKERLSATGSKLADISKKAAEAQEILEKYPQLDTSKSGAASKA